MIDEDALLAAGITYYRAVCDGQLELKPDLIDELLTSKQRAVIRGNFILIHNYGLADIENRIYHKYTDNFKQIIRRLE